MGYYTENQLKRMDFKSLGQNVKISDKASIYDCEAIAIADNSRIDDFCVLSGKLVIGRNVHITPQCLVAGGREGIVLSDFCCLSYGVSVFTQSDDYSGTTLTNSTIPSRYKNEYKARVFIGRHCIVGARSIIMPGVSLADGTSVGAMSLVTKSTEEWALYFGVPAKKIRNRKKDLLKLEAEYRRATHS